jgi:cytosine/uracil/thiamine/allantoin permease
VHFFNLKESIKKLEYFSSPFLFLMALALFIWACVKVLPSIISLIIRVGV